MVGLGMIGWLYFDGEGEVAGEGLVCGDCGGVGGVMSFVISSW